MILVAIIRTYTYKPEYIYRIQTSQALELFRLQNSQKGPSRAHLKTLVKKHTIPGRAFGAKVFKMGSIWTLSETFWLSSSPEPSIDHRGLKSPYS